MNFFVFLGESGNWFTCDITKGDHGDVGDPCDPCVCDITKGDNYVCVSKIQEHEYLRKLGSKSFTVANENGIITDIVEKEVVSDTFCIGGYKFEQAKDFTEAYKKLSTSREVFVSDVIGYCTTILPIMYGWTAQWNG